MTGTTRIARRHPEYIQPGDVIIWGLGEISPEAPREVRSIEYDRGHGFRTVISQAEGSPYSSMIMLEPSWFYSVRVAREAISPEILRQACEIVHRERAPHLDEPETLAESVEHARNTLRLPEDGHATGAWPLEETSNATHDRAYRLVLEATDAELAEVLA